MYYDKAKAARVDVTISDPNLLSRPAGEKQPRRLVPDAKRGG